VVSDNGPQFSSSEFQKFAKYYGFKHTTTSPHYPKANGEVERAVQTVKKLWGKNDYPYLALLDYRTAPLPDIDLSPAQLLMGRRLRNKLLMMESLLQPASNASKKSPGTSKRPRRIRRNIMTVMQVGTCRNLSLEPKFACSLGKNSKLWKPATVVKHHHTPRSYVVQAEDGRKYRRNRQHLRVCPAPGHATVNAELPSCADQTSVQNKEPPRDAESDQARVPIMLPDIPSKEQDMHPEPAKENITDRYVTRSGRKVVAPSWLDL